MVEMINIELFTRLCRDSIATEYGCWLWLRASYPRGGGGKVYWKGNMRNVNRLALELAGRSDEGNVSPSCGKPRCWNPAHLGPVIRPSKTPAEVCEHVLSQVLQIGTCLWLPSVRGRGGYGQVRVCGRLVTVHRLVYEQLVGPIPEGLHLDHLCYNRACVNIDHLEPVTLAENNRRAAARRRILKETAR